jgi:hypothetical protein
MLACFFERLALIHILFVVWGQGLFFWKMKKVKTMLKIITLAQITYQKLSYLTTTTEIANKRTIVVRISFGVNKIIS